MSTWDKDEPLLVNASQKVLDQADVAAFDVAGWVEANKIVQGEAAVAEHGRTPECCSDTIPRHGEPVRKDVAGRAPPQTYACPNN